MYINFNLAESKGLSPEKIIILQMIQQNRTEDLSPELEKHLKTDILSDFENAGYIEHRKAKNKSETVYNTIRLSVKGKEVLELIQIPVVDENDIRMFDYLCSIYLNSEDSERTIGNRKATQIYCAQFRQFLGLTPYEMYYLCELFISRVVFSKKLENIFFSKKDNPYGKFKDNIEASKLYQFYEDNKQEVENYWKLKIK